jgi:hypothetical protein
MYKSIILPVLSLTLREKQKFRMSKNKKLRIIFGPKMEVVTGVWQNAQLSAIQSGGSHRQNMLNACKNRTFLKI